MNEETRDDILFILQSLYQDGVCACGKDSSVAEAYEALSKEIDSILETLGVYL